VVEHSTADRNSSTLGLGAPYSNEDLFISIIIRLEALLPIQNEHRNEIRLNISTFSSSGERNVILNMSPPLAMSFNSDSPKIVFFWLYSN
jgi:hypothetical protein